MTRYEILRRPDDRVLIRLVGRLDEDDLLSCERELRTLLRATRGDSQLATVDVLQMSEYSLEARTVLIRMQSFLNTKARSTSYLADTAERRALALWVRHMTGDSRVSITAEVAPEAAFEENEPITGVQAIVPDADDGETLDSAAS